jgi:L-ascorbate metabolism protein UlaG (beta-lactamase superfamily)
LTDLDAVMVTHQHPDHLDPANLPALVQANAAAKILVEPSIMDLISAGDLPSLGANAAALPPDHQATIGDVLVTAVGGQHAIIYRDLPRIGNVGYLLRSEGQPRFSILAMKSTRSGRRRPPREFRSTHPGQR